MKKSLKSRKKTKARMEAGERRAGKRLKSWDERKSSQKADGGVDGVR